MKALRNWFILLSMLLLVHACGAMNSTKACDKEADPTCGDASTTKDVTTSDPYNSDSSLVLRGYVSSAFDLTVDKTAYSDSEDFYTKQLDKLTAEAESSGYKGWKMDFEAQIGLEDLKYDMRVYVASVTGRGFAGESVVDENGEFELTFPDAGKSTYKIRANKRISVSLTNPKDENDIVKWCYNFSAEEQSITLDPAKNEPVILSSFVTSLTKYECVVENSGGMSVPARKLPVVDPVAAPAAVPAAEATDEQEVADTPPARTRGHR